MVMCVLFMLILLVRIVLCFFRCVVNCNRFVVWLGLSLICLLWMMLCVCVFMFCYLWNWVFIVCFLGVCSCVFFMLV